MVGSTGGRHRSNLMGAGGGIEDPCPSGWIFSSCSCTRLFLVMNGCHHDVYSSSFPLASCPGTALYCTALCCTLAPPPPTKVVVLVTRYILPARATILLPVLSSYPTLTHSQYCTHCTHFRSRALVNLFRVSRNPTTNTHSSLHHKQYLILDQPGFDFVLVTDLFGSLRVTSLPTPQSPRPLTHIRPACRPSRKP
jgi:hypothetical protein